MATKKDLFKEVKRLNDKYCRTGKNQLEVHQAYGGYAVELVGKRNKRTGNLLKGAMHGAASIGNDWHDTATKTLKGLYNYESRGFLKNQINYYNRKGKK